MLFLLPCQQVNYILEVEIIATFNFHSFWMSM